MRISDQSRLGTAGEYLVCADLTLQGHSATMAPAGEPYDIIVDIGGTLKRIQVKASSRPSQSGSHCFHLTSRSTGKERVHRLIDLDGVDILALVMLDEKKVGYFGRRFMEEHRFKAQIRSQSNPPKGTNQFDCLYIEEFSSIA